ncbi:MULTISPECIES: 23S rRNA (adenine(1618)-N(6))-methyltransferase RlmF [Psychrilyobacter]|uniref:23S rRNA (Adenine(1618)-N(6))-methyltransferase RlmF n=1 Tax=Psychrilyobacter piezotolerans TaxID=2293438 RepID=A0ABX9KHR7_9FUSO|nr:MULTISPECIES: 23S rRNA (adenine(1618)-N(6))-methyltransferase RlmF [Psychrilyobacter]MCS5421816.1 23S rRNA (adenine(1618)-N(6))-methyltransferase RlmF [Psychrilyobacter sp. S5]NDI77586.1 23S rRNA (adenine(1618)-N(6))-methyltransferase RlmF [Psychrilyobacter piezotolerans]RDE62906.1 23S rRNA (adenine(1618)-N(6))-methyltransferase RlmF [Psychrilyobacter sp. S5]REI41664.1 23S rRNA (adenine(1618)-N(6))-methyltransferase RlmF [Psychrilyobacter piezotolerans]
MNNKKQKGFHLRNPHSGRYDFKSLIEDSKELKKYIKNNPSGDNTIDFGDEKAVLELNRALLKSYYEIKHWGVPEGFLCPPIPGRADYIHHISDLVLKSKKDIKVLDIGTGANCIYPIIGNRSYGWKFIASDIDPVSVENAKEIIQKNHLGDSIVIKLQTDKNNFFKGIIDEEYVDITMCNPPFHASLKEALSANKQKRDNLNKTRSSNLSEKLNFGGQKAELWCKGGEILFLKKMARESLLFSKKVGYFTSLISKGENVKPMEKILKKLGAWDIRVIEMVHGNKISRIVAWTFDSKK